MGERNLKLVADNKPRKRHILLLFACLAVVFGMGIYFLITDFSIQKIQISGNNTYTNAEIIEAMKEDGYIDNTLLMIAQNQIFDQTYLPFIEKVSMSYDDSHILKVKVKEKLRTGVFKYMNEYVYFNENGIAMESRNTLFEGVPVVTGVKFNEMNLKRKILENKIIGILEIKPSLIAFKYLFLATLSKNGFIFSIGLIIASIHILLIFYKHQ